MKTVYVLNAGIEAMEPQSKKSNDFADCEDVVMKKLRFADYRSDKKNIRKLYEASFPKEEKIPFFILDKRAKSGSGEFMGVYDDRELIGLVYNACYRDMLYIFFFAIDKTKQDNGYGSQILSTIKSRYHNKRIFLYIELMDPEARNYKQRLRRKAFYERNGFSLLDFQAKEAAMTYGVMELEGRGKQITIKDCEDLMSYFFGIWGLWFRIQVYVCVLKKRLKKERV